MLCPPSPPSARAPEHRPCGLYGCSPRAAARKIQSRRHSRRRLVVSPRSNAPQTPESMRDPLGCRSQQCIDKRFHSMAWCRERRIHGRGAVPGLAPEPRLPHRSRPVWASLDLRGYCSRARPAPHHRRHFEIPPRAFSGFFSDVSASAEPVQVVTQTDTSKGARGRQPFPGKVCDLTLTSRLS